MTPSEFKQARVTLGLSHAKLGRILNTNPRTVRYWEDDSGKRPPNPIACRIVQWMLAGELPADWPKRGT